MTPRPPSAPADPPELPAGLYRHYKGHLYQALGYGADANDATRRLVLYVGLQLDGAVPGQPRLHARTAVSPDPAIDAWWDRVHADGTKCTHPQPEPSTMPRFQYLGPSWNDGR